MDMGNNKWWTKWLGVGSTPAEKGSTKHNNDKESDNNMGSSGTTSTVGPEAWWQKHGPKHSCGLWCRPLIGCTYSVRESPRQRRYSAATGRSNVGAERQGQPNGCGRKERGTSRGGESIASVRGRQGGRRRNNTLSRKHELKSKATP